MLKRFLAAVTGNPVSLIGTGLAVAALTLVTSLFAVQWMGFDGGPYLGILTFLIMPGFLALGLIMVPFGFYWQRKRAARHAAAGEDAQVFPVIDLNKDTTRKAVLVVFFVVMLNIVILAGATYKGVEVMDSTAFCGLACHQVMQPEYTAHARSPHARIDCVDCHIGPGADWFVRSKLDGAWQMVAVAFDLYPRPIQTPLHNLRPARDTCEQCHYPSAYIGDKLKLERSFAPDESNTQLTSALLLRVGGRKGDMSSGIHWHTSPDMEIRYRSDPTRMTIYEIQKTAADGSVTTWRSGVEPDGADEWRVMDCVDCHNRPTHVFRSPAEEIDRAMLAGALDSSLPYLKRESLRLLESADYDSHDAARIGLSESLKAFYQQNYPEIVAVNGSRIDDAAKVLGDIFSWNVFPHMQVRWDQTYADHRGHPDLRQGFEGPGCFRCHNPQQRTEDGRGISFNCTSCHSVVISDEQDPDLLRLLRL